MIANLIKIFVILLMGTNLSLAQDTTAVNIGDTSAGRIEQLYGRDFFVTSEPGGAHVVSHPQ